MHRKRKRRIEQLNAINEELDLDELLMSLITINLMNLMKIKIVF